MQKKIKIGNSKTTKHKKTVKIKMHKQKNNNSPEHIV